MQRETSFAPSLLTSFVAALGLSLLLFLEQQRSPKPSDLATLYLVASVLCDVALLTSPSSKTEISHPVFVRCIAHLVLLLLQSFCKPSSAGILNDSKSPEELNGILGRVFFTWINPILRQGYKNLLVDQNLSPLSRDIKPEVTRKSILQIWYSRGMSIILVDPWLSFLTNLAKPETRMSLLFALLKCIKPPFLDAVIPRLFLIVFRYSQPALIKQTIKFITTYSGGAASNYGYWLIWSAGN